MNSPESNNSQAPHGFVWSGCNLAPLPPQLPALLFLVSILLPAGRDAGLPAAQPDLLSEPRLPDAPLLAAADEPVFSSGEELFLTNLAKTRDMKHLLQNGLGEMKRYQETNPPCCMCRSPA